MLVELRRNLAVCNVGGWWLATIKTGSWRVREEVAKEGFILTKEVRFFFYCGHERKGTTVGS